MDLRPLGTTGLLVSPVGLGTVKLGRNQGVRYPRPFELPTDEQAIVLLRACTELGVNLIDTAPAYGTSEQRLGEIMAANNWFGGRQRWVVCTKAGEEFEGGVSRFDFSPAAIRRSVERSLTRLRTDTLDIVLLHSGGWNPADMTPERGAARERAIVRDSGALDALLRLKSEGRLRAVGISSKTVEGGLAALESGCDVLMVAYNLRDQEQAPVIRGAAARGAGVLIKKGLLGGYAVGQEGGDAVEASLRFIFDEPGVSSVVVGTINPGHLEQNVLAARRALGP